MEEAASLEAEEALLVISPGRGGKEQFAVMKSSYKENTGSGCPALSYSKFCNCAKSAARLELGIKAMAWHLFALIPAIWGNSCLLANTALAP